MSSELTISKNGVFLLFYFYVFIIRPEGAQKRRKVCEEWVVVLSFNHGFIANNFAYHRLERDILAVKNVYRQQQDN